jgi:hypothetical protein
MDTGTSAILTQYESVQFCTKMKEPLRGTRYNTREEIIHAVGRSLLDIESGRADGVQCLPQIWQKVVHMGGGGATILEECKCVYLR